MRLRASLLLLLVPLAHWLYHAFDDGAWGAQWAQWIAEHGAGVVLCLLLLERVREWSGWPLAVGVSALLWMAFEDAQCAVCGAMDWAEPNQSKWAQLCVDRFGSEPYIVGLSAAMAVVIMKFLKREPHEQNG